MKNKIKTFLLLTGLVVSGCLASCTMNDSSSSDEVTSSKATTNQLTTGEGAPSDSVGNDGDVYVDSLTMDYYSKENGTWVKKGNLNGTDGTNGVDGTDGEDGNDGEDGRGIVSIEKTSSEGNTDTYTITYTDGTTSTFIVTNGSDGEQGIQGEKGEDGHTPVITIGENGNWYIDGVDTGVAATGAQGEKGDTGEDGQDGSDGRGIVSIEKTSSEGNVDTYTITYTDGTTSTFTVTNGQDGEDGKDGTDGANGVDGKDGSSLLTGDAAPSVEEGNDGDSYIDTTTWDYYVKVDGVWILKGNIKGEDAVSASGKYVVECWGDSLTRGSNGGWVTRLQTHLPEYQVNNYGVGGESSNAICARKGAMLMYAQPEFTIPAAKEKVEVSIEDDEGSALRLCLQGTAGLNPVTINGIEGNLSATFDTGYTNVQMYFTRSEEGEEMTISRPTIVSPYASSFNGEGHTLICFIGQNGGWSNNPEVLVNQCNKMVDINGSNRYLILGLTSGTASSRSELESAMYQEFGAHYVNLRDYLSTYGMQDAGLTPTEEDQSLMDVGSVPASLRSDGVHFNQTGYNLIGDLVYERGAILNYW